MYKSGVEPFMGEVHQGEAVVLEPEVSHWRSLIHVKRDTTNRKEGDDDVGSYEYPDLW